MVVHETASWQNELALIGSSIAFIKMKIKSLNIIRVSLFQCIPDRRKQDHPVGRQSGPNRSDQRHPLLSGK